VESNHGYKFDKWHFSPLRLWVPVDRK